MVTESGRYVHGIDFSQTMVDLRRKQVPEGSFETINMVDFMPSTHFDGIVAMLSLFEITRDEITSMAYKWAKWLHPGGSLLIGVFGGDNYEIKPEMFDYDGKFANPIPFRFMKHKVSMNLFTKAGWIDLLETAGLYIVHTDTKVLIPPPSAMSDTERQYFVISQKPTLR